MAELPSCARFIRGQSPNGTSPARNAGGAACASGGIMVAMAFTIFFVLALLPGQARADDTRPHVTAVAVARAQIVSGVRVGAEAQKPANTKRDVREAPSPRPRERPCPEREAVPCRLLVIDME